MHSELPQVDHVIGTALRRYQVTQQLHDLPSWAFIRRARLHRELNAVNTALHDAVQRLNDMEQQTLLLIVVAFTLHYDPVVPEWRGTFAWLAERLGEDAIAAGNKYLVEQGIDTSINKLPTIHDLAIYEGSTPD